MSASGNALAALFAPQPAGCDPSRQSCATTPEPQRCTPVSPSVDPVEPMRSPATFDFELEVAAPASLDGRLGEVERIRLANPLLWWRREDLYAVPIELVFATPEQARGFCPAPWAPAASLPGPIGPTPAPPFVSNSLAALDQPFTFASPPLTSTPAPAHSSPPLALASFGPGDTAYTLDGPIKIVSATSRYVFTRTWSKLAVGAGSFGVASTSAGYVVVDAGMKQVGGRFDADLADALVDALDALIGAGTEIDIQTTHLHLDHTLLIPRVYARHPVRALHVNALQAFIPARSGSGTELERIVRESILRRQLEVARKVQAELVATGSWPDAQTLAAEVQRVTQQRIQAMPPTPVRLAIPQGGTIVQVDVPIGNIALPSQLVDTSPITRPLGGANMATLLNPGAGVATQQLLATGRVSTSAVDAQATSLVVKMPSGALLLVISDVRIEEAVDLTAQLTVAISQLSDGKQVPFIALDATHHLGRGFGHGDAVARASQLAAWTRMLYDVQRQAGGGTKLAGGALVVSINGGPGQPSNIDPGIVWALKESGWAVMPATGGGVRGPSGNLLGAAQDIHVIEVALGDTKVSGVVGPAFPGLEGEQLIQRAHAAMSRVDGERLRIQKDLADAADPTQRGTFEQQIRDKTAQRERIALRLKAYIADGTAAVRSAAAATGATAPLPAPVLAAGAALRDELAGFTDIVVGGDQPRFVAEALVVIGLQELAQHTVASRALLAAYERVAALSSGLRWSTPADERRPLVDVLELYRALLRAAAARTESPYREILEREVARADADLTTLTGRSSAELEAIRAAAALAAQASKNVARPGEVGSLAQLGDGKKANEIIAQHDGYVLAAGRLYRVTSTGTGFSINTVQLEPASIPRPAEPAPRLLGPRLVSFALPPPRATMIGPVARPEPILVPGPVPEGFAEMPNILNISGRTIVLSTGQTIAPTPSEPLSQARPGELIVRGFSGGYFVADPITGRPIAGAMVGGEWWQVNKDGTLTLLVDSAGRVQRAGAAYAFESGPLEEVAPGRPVGTPERAASGYGPGMRAVAGGMSLVMVVNDILGPIGAILNQQRRNIAQGQAQIAFWSQFGGNPTVEMRTQNSDEVQRGAAPETAAVYGDPVYPRVVGIDTAGLKKTLEASIQTHADLMNWLFLGRIIDAIKIDPDLGVATSQRSTPRTYAAWIAGTEGTRDWRQIDITDIVEAIEQRTVAALEGTMQARVAALSNDERAKVFALRSGSDARILRNKVTGFWHKGVSEVVRSSSATFGPTPWVHVVKREGGHALVEAANADAGRGAGAAAYEIRKSLGDVLDEVKAGGRPIKQEWRDGGTLVGFVAGASPTDPRFQGETRYYKSSVPDFVSLFGDGTRPDWTAAFGQLDQFWVDADELVPLDAGVLDRYAAAKKP